MCSKGPNPLTRQEFIMALGTTDLDTIVGHVKYYDKHYAETFLVGGQWMQGKKVALGAEHCPEYRTS